MYGFLNYYVEKFLCINYIRYKLEQIKYMYVLLVGIGFLKGVIKIKIYNMIKFELLCIYF